MNVWNIKYMILAYQPNLAPKSDSIIVSLVFQNSCFLKGGIAKPIENSIFFHFCRWAKQLRP
jgi:hypothetical protein